MTEENKQAEVQEQELVAETQAEEPKLSDEEQFAADFPEMEGEPEKKTADENVVADPVQEEAQEEEVSYDEYDQKLEDLVRQNQAQSPDMPQMAKEIKLETELLPEDTDDEITNEINRAVNRQAQANAKKQEAILNQHYAEMNKRLSQAEQLVKQSKLNERQDAEQKFKAILQQQGHKPDAYLDRLQKYVNSLPKDQVDMVYNTAKGVKSALIFQTMFEADLGNYQKLSAEDVAKARKHGERAATERLRANPSSGSGGAIDSQKRPTVWDDRGRPATSDSEWAKIRDSISDEEAFG